MGANTPTTTFPTSIAIPAGAGCDLLYSDTAIPNSVVAGQWFGPDGVYTTFNSAAVFDTRAYRLLHATLSASSLTGGTAPTAQLLFLKVDDLTGNKQLNQMTVTGTIAAAGGLCEAYIGEMAMNAALAINGTYNSTIAGFVGRAEFFKVGFVFTGAPTGIAGGRFFLWGYR